ncbi:MAG: serine/threonine protein kinase, partial [Chloroflexota bacterium]
MEGTPFGRYLLQEQIGRGGMGVVYRAWDTELGRAVALKTLVGESSSDRTPSPSPAGTPQSVGVARFLREARAAARLVHPNVIRVY